MATFRLPHFSSPHTLQTIDRSRLLAFLQPYREFFANRRLTLPDAASTDPVPFEQLIRVLMSPDEDTPHELIDALHYVDGMSTTEGMQTLIAAARVAGLALEGDTLTPADVAVQIWLLAPSSLELSLRAAERAEQDRERLHTHWKQRQERAGYEADRARRQYDAVDPENRLVARELERQWDQKLREKQKLDEDHTRFLAEQPRHLSVSDRERIGTLARDLPGLWRSSTTTGGDRRAIVRLLIERVELTRHGQTQRVEVKIHWRGGTTTRHEVMQGLRKYTSMEGYAELRQRIVALRGDGWTANRIAEVLNEEGYRVARGEKFTGHRVRQLWARFGQAGVPAGVRDASDLPGRGECWLPELAKRLAVTPIIVHRWRWSGWLHARQLRGENGRWIVWTNVAEAARLRKLRAFEVKHHGRRTPPLELTAPAKRKGSGGPTTDSQSGGK